MPTWRSIQGKFKGHQFSRPPQETTDSLASHKVFPLGLETFFEPEAATVDVIFIHGLTGDREKTWTAPEATEPWPKTLLPLKIPQARILTFGYDAYVADWRGMVSQNRINNHASNLVASIATRREDDDTDKRPIIFVAHSLGGLVCEDALLVSRNSAEIHLQNILKYTRGILFLGTPHSGAGLAVWAEALAKSVGLFKQTNSQMLKVLQTDSEVLSRIQTDFHTMLRARADRGLRALTITCFYEELPLPGIGDVVPKHSAILPAYASIGIRRNHKDMTKFENANDPGFTSVVGELRRWIRELSPASASLPSTSVPDHRGQSSLGSEESSRMAIPNAPSSLGKTQAPRGSPDGIAGWNIFHAAVANNNIASVERLLSLGRDPNCVTDEKHWTPLWIAAAYNHLHIGKLLLAAGVKVDAAATDGTTPLHQTAMIGTTDFSLELLRHGAAIESNQTQYHETPLISAAAKGHIDTVHLFLAHGANCTAQQSGGWSALHYAVLHHNEQLASVLLEADHTTANLATQKGVKPIHLAAMAGMVGLVRRLLELGVDIDGTDLGGLTALRLAVQEGQLEIVKLMLDHGASMDVLADDGLNLSKVAHLAGQVDVAMFLEDYER